MLWHRGRCPTNWYQGRRSYVWYLKGYKWCHSNIQVISIKNARFKPQPSIPNANLCINEKHTFYGNWWQRRRDCTKIWKLWETLKKRSRGWTWTWTKREQHLRNWEGSKFLDKRSTQVGGQAHELWLVAFDMCIFMCLLALHEFFKIWYACLCVVC